MFDAHFMVELFLFAVLGLTRRGWPEQLPVDPQKLARRRFLGRERNRRWRQKRAAARADLAEAGHTAGERAVQNLGPRARPRRDSPAIGDLFAATEYYKR